MKDNLDTIRENTLNQIEKTERNYKLMFIGAALVEIFFIASFVLLADFSNKLHLLLMISSITIYTIVGCGLFAVGLHINRNALRIIMAIEAIGEKKM